MKGRPNLHSTDKFTDPSAATESADMQIWLEKRIPEMETTFAANQNQRLADIAEKCSKETAHLEETLMDI